MRFIKSSPSNFEKMGYTTIKNAINKELAQFIYEYFLLKREVYNTFIKDGYISPLDSSWGTHDRQVPNTYAHYADICMETLLKTMLPLMESTTNLKLVPTYSYARIYKKGDVLERHKDRISCEISTTLNLGGDSWPIYIDTDYKSGEYSKDKLKYTSQNNPGIKINLEPGDMLLYKGNLLEHWREAFEGENCGQVFLHYNQIGSKFENKYDGRPHLGLPSDYKKDV